MVKKRELTAETWVKVAEMNARFAADNTDAFIEANEKLGIDIVCAIFETQMALAWKRSGLQAYEFDADFAGSILPEKWVDLLPGCIEHRPHDCFYMKLPFNNQFEGVVVNIVPTEDVVNFEPELFPGALDAPGVYFGGNTAYGTRALVNTGKRTYALCSFAIAKSMEMMLDDTVLEPYPTGLVVNGVAYICSENADIRRSYVPQVGLKRNNAKKRSAATWYEVGYTIGADLRSYEKSRRVGGRSLGGTVRPHMRRAHWHHYWVGPKNGERRLVLKWLSPTIVAAYNGGVSVTGHKVG